MPPSQKTHPPHFRRRLTDAEITQIITFAHIGQTSRGIAEKVQRNQSTAVNGISNIRPPEHGFGFDEYPEILIRV